MRSKIILFVAAVATCSAQSLSVGILGGAGVTQDFQNQVFPAGPGYPGLTNYSTPKRYTFGAMLEISLPKNLLLEIDGMYRPLEYTFAGILPDGKLNSVSPSTVVTWEFPVLAKYRFGAGRYRPFIEAGPSFRTAGNLNSANPGHVGAAAGVGVDIALRALTISPSVRYTHWDSDQRDALVRTLPNQVEVLVGFSRPVESAWRPMGNRVLIGVLAGTNLSSDFSRRINSITFISSSPAPGGGYTTTEVNGTVYDYAGPRSPIAGPSFDVRIAGNLSAEVDALYRPWQSESKTVLQDGTVYGPSSSSDLTWEFPVLAKYRFLSGRWRPLVEAGPSFRLPQGLAGASHFGVTAGAGLETRLRRLRIAPVLRYTRWRHSNPPNVTNVSLDELTLLLDVAI